MERQWPSCLSKLPPGSSLRWPRVCAEPLEYAAADHPEGKNEEEEEEAGIVDDEDDAEEGEEEDEAAAPVLFHGEPQLCLTPHPTERPAPPAPA